MSRGVRNSLLVCVGFLALAGCGRGILQYAEREPWRREAEATCLKSGNVRESAARVRIESIAGPGTCGADYPLKVASLGDVSSAMGFAEGLRPPGAIPNASPRSAQPRWPIAPQTVQVPQRTAPPADQDFVSQRPAPGAPMSLSPPGMDRSVDGPDEPDEPRTSYGSPQAQPEPLPSYTVVRTRPARVERDEFERAPVAAPPPALGPARPLTTGSVTPVEVKPTATLACPIVSALDRWIAAAVQPAAQKWFGQPVVEIRQISAYSCRGMNGQVGARISEHAFGNALDIAAFVLADGTRITVKNGWKGSPEEQGFLRDVQGAACDTFTTVLAPGSNRFHYDHFHVDLMRRASGRRICNPRAEDGEVIAARARGNPMYASRKDARPPTRRSAEPFDSRQDPFSVSGRRGADPTPTGSIGAKRAAVRGPVDDDDDWVEDEGPRPAIDWGGDKHKVH